MTATSTQALRASSSSCPVADGMLGKAPKPFLATSCSPMSAAVQAVRGQACAQPQSRALHRSPRTPWGRLGLSSKSADCLSLPGLFRGSWRDTEPPFLACVNGTLEPILRCLRACSRPSKATCCVDRARSQTTCRSAGSCARLRLIHPRSPSCKPLCSGLNSISCGSEMAASPFGSARSSVCVHEFPFLNVI